MLRLVLVVLAILALFFASAFAFDAPILRLTSIIAGTCLILWLTEIVPPFVPTLLLCAFTPLLLGPFDKNFALPSVLKWAIDPVLVLFFGGFVLGVAAERHGFDKRLANVALHSAGNSFAKFLFLISLARPLVCDN